MSETKTKNSPSNTTSCHKHDGGRRSSKTTTIAVADPSQEILQAVNDMLALTRIDNGNVNEEDMSDFIENTDALLEEKKIERPVRKMYQRYQNLWTFLCKRKNKRKI